MFKNSYQIEFKFINKISDSISDICICLRFKFHIEIFFSFNEYFLQKNRKQLVAQIDTAMGGRVAEELVFGAENITGGAMSDVANASKIGTS